MDWIFDLLIQLGTTSNNTVIAVFLTVQFITAPAKPESQSQNHVTIDGQSASLSWNKALVWGLRPEFYYCLQLRVCGGGTLSLTSGRVCRLQLLLALARAVFFRVRVPRYSSPCFAVSDSRLPQPGGPGPRIYIPPGAGWPSYTPRDRVPFSSPPTTRRATVEVFDPASTRDPALPNLVSLFYNQFARVKQKSSFLNIPIL
jgi:hypothetical protein